MLNLANYYQSSTYVKPDWRWNRVLNICDQQPRPGRPARRDDWFVRKGRTFLLKWRGASQILDPEDYRQNLFLEDPGLYLAFELNEKSTDDSTPVHIIQARILAGQTNEEIAMRLATIPEAIDWYEQLFFHVRPKLKQKDWVYHTILLPACVRHAGVGQKDNWTKEEEYNANASYRATPIVSAMMDMTLKLFAYYYGPVMLDFMITGVRPGGRVSSADQIPVVLSEHFSDTILRRAAQAAQLFSVNKFNVMQLFETATKIMDLKLKAEDLDEGGKTAVENQLSRVLTQIPWSVGKDGAEMVRGTEIGRIDESAAELRDDELLLVAAGENVTSLEGITDLKIRELTRESK